ncbi:hypothetical protein OAT84_03115, partial [Gammaproteobacteria bacterium]|nr:hypothetical protein [Gammaproteobacteria bacterium]
NGGALDFTKDEFIKYARIGLLPYLPDANTQLFEALKSKYLPLTSKEFLSCLHRQSSNTDTYRIGKNVNDKTFGYILKDKIDLSDLEEDMRDRISFLIHAGQVASNSDYNITSNSASTITVTSKSYEGYEQEPYFIFAIAQLLNDKPSLAKDMLRKLSPDYLTQHASSILANISKKTKVTTLAPVLSHLAKRNLKLTIPKYFNHALRYQIHLYFHMKKRYDEIYCLVQSIVLKNEPIEITMPIHLAKRITRYAARPNKFRGINNPKPDFCIDDLIWHQTTDQHLLGKN